MVILRIVEVLLMDTNTVKLFDSKNKLVPNFDDEIEKILISIHGEQYYDTDEPLVNTNLIPISNILNEDKYEEEEIEKTMEIDEGMVTDDAPKINIVNNKDIQKIRPKDFLPVLFFILVFAVIVVAGYYFLNSIDLMSLIN